MLIEELEGLRRRGIDPSDLRISANAHLIMPYHVMLDTAGEAKLGKLEIGTTKRGIGPCYADKAARLGIRVQDLLDGKILRKKIAAALEPKQQMLRPFARDPRLDLHAMTEEYLRYGHRLEPHIADTARLCWDALDSGKQRALRGRPGDDARPRPRHLSVRHLLEPRRRCRLRRRRASGPADIGEVWGVAKAYATRVGAGPFPTELDDELGARLRERGGERGTTTGRDRRVGWLDLVALRYAVRLNTMTGADDHQARRARGHRPAARSPSATAAPRAPFSTSSPGTSRSSTAPRPNTRSCPASTSDISDCRSEEELPQAARDYLRLHRRGRRRADPPRRRRPGPRPGDLDRRARARSCARRRRRGPK